MIWTLSWTGIWILSWYIWTKSYSPFKKLKSDRPTTNCFSDCWLSQFCNYRWPLSSVSDSLGCKFFFHLHIWEDLYCDRNMNDSESHPLSDLINNVQRRLDGVARELDDLFHANPWRHRSWKSPKMSHLGHVGLQLSITWHLFWGISVERDRFSNASISVSVLHSVF